MKKSSAAYLSLVLAFMLGADAAPASRPRGGTTGTGCFQALGDIRRAADRSAHIRENEAAILKNISQLATAVTSERRRFELAHQLAQTNPAAVAENFSSFHLPRRQFRNEVALEVARRNPEVYLSHLKNFNLSPEENLQCAIQIINSRYPADTEAAVNEVISKLADMRLDSSQRNRLLLTIWAKLRSQAYPEKFPFSRARDFDLSEADRERFARLVHEYNSWYFYSQIAHFGLTATQRFTLAREFAGEVRETKDKEYLLSQLHSFGFTKKENLEIVKLVMESSEIRYLEDLTPGTLTDTQRLSLQLELLDPKKIISDPSIPDFVFNRPNHFKFSSPDKNYAFLLKLFSAYPKGRLPHIGENFRAGFSEFALGDSQRVKLALFVTERFGLFENLDQISALNLPIEEHRFALFKAVVTEPGHAESPESVEAYLQTIPRYRFQALRLIVGSGVLRFVDELPARQRFPALIEAASVKPAAVASEVGKTDLTLTQRFEIALKIAQRAPAALDSHIASFRLTEPQRAEVAKITMAHEVGSNGEPFSRFPTYRIKDQRLRSEIALAHLISQPSTPVERLARAFSLDAAEARRLHRVAFSRNPLGFLEILDPSVVGSAAGDDVHGVAHVTKILTAFAKRNPDILPEAWIHTAWDRVKKVETGFMLLKLLYERSAYHIERPVPRDSLGYFA